MKLYSIRTPAEFDEMLIENLPATNIWKSMQQLDDMRDVVAAINGILDKFKAWFRDSFAEKVVRYTLIEEALKEAGYELVVHFTLLEEIKVVEASVDLRSAVGGNLTERMKPAEPIASDQAE